MVCELCDDTVAAADRYDPDPRSMVARERLLDEGLRKRVLDVDRQFGLWSSGHAVHRLAGSRRQRSPGGRRGAVRRGDGLHGEGSR